MLVTTALHDSCVRFWEPAKMVAKLRSTEAGLKQKKESHVERKILLWTEMNAGHAGMEDQHCP